jgi:hypothetical protein
MIGEFVFGVAALRSLDMISHIAVEIRLIQLGLANLAAPRTRRFAWIEQQYVCICEILQYDGMTCAQAATTAACNHTQ